MNLLYISHTAPFDKASMAGEKTLNYYLKSFSKEKDINVKLITVCNEKDKSRLDYEKYNIEAKVLVEKQDKVSCIIRKYKRAIRYIVFPNDKYANFVSEIRRKFIINELYELRNGGYYPDVIILEFTHSILLVDEIKRIYGNTKIVGSSHDVNYRGSYRIYTYEKNIIKKFFRKRQYLNLKKREINAISKCDLIVTQNKNDINIFREHELLRNKQYLCISPYYDSYSDIYRNSDERTLLFYGAMNRAENYKSVIWFIENVLYKLPDEFKFVIAGGNPPKVVKNYESNRIHVTGFLDINDLRKLFSSCMCMVVPLQLGSGIKVKVLEAFSGGIPVLTNEIGNEGIFAENGKSVIICNDAHDFISAIYDAKNNTESLQVIGGNGKKYLAEHFDLLSGFNNYLKKVKEIVYN